MMPIRLSWQSEHCKVDVLRPKTALASHYLCATPATRLETPWLLSLSNSSASHIWIGSYFRRLRCFIVGM